MDTCARIRSARGDAGWPRRRAPSGGVGPGTGPGGTARLTVLAVATAFGLFPCLSGPATAQEREADTRDWVVPRTPAGHPDLQGNWSNATVTPIQRRHGMGPVFTWEQVKEIESRVMSALEAANADSDPERGPPPVGGQFTGDPPPGRGLRGNRRLQRLLHRLRRPRGGLQRRTADLARRRPAERAGSPAQRGRPGAARAAPALRPPVRFLRQPGEPVAGRALHHVVRVERGGRPCCRTTSTTTTTRSCRHRITS